jgi:uncharacterized membrane protein
MANRVIAASFFIHMVATVIWVGGITLMALVVYPGVRRVLGAGPQAGAVMAELHRRFSPLAMISLAALGVTGLAQMSVNTHYNGFLQINNSWAVALLLKHVAYLVMAGLGAYSVWGITPALNRLAMLEAKGKPAGEALAALRRREERLNRINFVCALVVLFFTAVARAV